MNNTWVKKLKRILIVERPELSGKLWHRLANVLIYGSTILIILVPLCIGLISVPTQANQSDPANLEIEPNSAPMSVSDFANQIRTNSGGAYQDVPDQNLVQAMVNKYPVYRNNIDTQIAPQGIGREWAGLSLRQIAFQFLIALPFVLLWFIFWESIVYRIIIYVIYGKK